MTMIMITIIIIVIIITTIIIIIIIMIIISIISIIIMIITIIIIVIIVIVISIIIIIKHRGGATPHRVDPEPLPHPGGVHDPQGVAAAALALRGGGDTPPLHRLLQRPQRGGGLQLLLPSTRGTPASSHRFCQLSGAFLQACVMITTRP
jgi:hypothetical protein